MISVPLELNGSQNEESKPCGEDLDPTGICSTVQEDHSKPVSTRIRFKH